MKDYLDADPSDFVDPLSDYEPAEYTSELERALAEETVSVMQMRPFEKIGPNATVRDAVHALHRSQVASALVVDDEGALMGLFTERDVLERVAERYDRVADQLVSEVMTWRPTVVYETDPVAAAFTAIAIAGHRHVPVVDVNDKVIGLISPRRAFDYLEQHDL